MLDILRKVVLAIADTDDLNEVLSIMASNIKQAMNTDVCSIYLYNSEQKEYLLMATEGLNPNAIGKVRLNSNEGLVGLVGAREEPLNVDDAQAHPKFHLLSATDEHHYQSFLGAPIIHHKRLLGVMVVQQKERRLFDSSEEAFLVTLSAQLAGVIAHAEATGHITAAPNAKQAKACSRFKGNAGAPGVGLGVAIVMTAGTDLNGIVDKTPNSISAELEKFEQALECSRQDVVQLSNAFSDDLRPEEMALFDVYLNMMNDDALGGEVRSHIQAGNWAVGALRTVILEYESHFKKMEDPYLRERAADIRDLGTRILGHLQGTKRYLLSDDFHEHSILVGDEITPTMLMEVPTKQLAGLVSVQGACNSHVAILAKAMGVPAIMGISELPYAQLAGHELIVDGYRGVLIANPSQELRQEYQKVHDDEQSLQKDLQQFYHLKAQTKDGYHLPLYVNTGLMTDSIISLDRGAEGVGLYRTEVPFMVKTQFPSEQEQQRIYREQLQMFAPHPVTMRTLDIGGDKPLSYFPIEEANPFLGWRGIRITLDHPEIFLLQVRAMLKASVGLNNLRIMLPMISNLSEIESAQHLIYRAVSEVQEEGFQIEMPAVGVMIEVPSSVYLIQQIAQMVDFVSVGSNDLTQYLLAVDRNNPRVSELYQMLHPAVLQALQIIVDGAHAAGHCNVGLCGELAGQPEGAVLLLAMGYDVLSMNAASLPKIKAIICGIDKTWANALLHDVMQLDDGQVIAATVQLALEKVGFKRLLNPLTHLPKT